MVFPSDLMWYGQPPLRCQARDCRFRDRIQIETPPSSSLVRTPAFQAGDTGSNPVGGTIAALYEIEKAVIYRRGQV